MEYLTLVFPIALVIFLGMLFIFEYIPAAASGARTLCPPETGSMTRRDRVILLLITLAYAVTGFWGLGKNEAPQTFCRFEKSGQYACIELRGECEIGALMYYTGLYSGAYRLQFSADGENWTDQTAMEQKHSSLFKWQYAELLEDNGPVRFIRITADSELWLGEVALYDGQGQLIPTDHLIIPDGCASLFDEQQLVPEAPDYLNGTYFDEIYHARTAYENVENVYPYEISHPPLGKLIISIGIRLFGMTPFGWRCMGTLFGVLMLPILYVLLKKLFSHTVVSACCTLIFAFDFMHFTQTRIATIDTYGVFFTLCMYLFMYLYLTSERGPGKSRRWLLWLALSGLSFGLGAASKWTCVYAGAGLGLIWLIDRIARGIRLCRSGLKWHYIHETAENILWCLLFFIAVPCLVYYLSYYPYGKASGMSGIGMYFQREYFDIVIENQKFMFTYHSGVMSEHPYSSRWYQWILNIRPILYYLKYFDDGTRSSFGAFLNPALCWGGLMAMIAVGHQALFRRDERAVFILVGYLAQLVPWMLIGRTTFEYHYFPSAVFLTLAVGYVFCAVRERRVHWRHMVFGFTGVSLALFFVFYPVLTGVTIPVWYGRSFLRWIPGWWPF